MLTTGKMVVKRNGFFAEGIPPDATGLVVRGPYLKILKLSPKHQAETFVVDVLVNGEIYEQIPIAELKIAK